MALGARIRKLFSGGGRGESLFEELEEILIEGDLGASLAIAIVSELREAMKRSRIESREELTAALKELLRGIVRAKPLTLEPQRLNLLLVLGVNGVGKTTTIAKLADYFRRTEGVNEVILGAGDTFRAGAIDQLKIHGERLGVRVVSQEPGSDPGAVIYDSIESARARGARLVLADTAGRMHNKANLVKELQKIDRVARNRIGDGCYRTVLVVDATTGQNGLKQAESFNEAIGIDSAILTKYDSTAKGGIAVQISKSLGIPFSFIGKGEKLTDLEVFDVERYLDSLLD